MDDICLRASDRAAHLEVAVATTTKTCRDARDAHGFGTTSAIGLGRLLSATALVALTSKRPGTTSIQVLSRGRIKQLYADATATGEVRGYTKNGALEFPLTPRTGRVGRQSIAAMVMPGQVSVIRSNERGEYVQSSTSLVSGEVDRDVEAYLIQSEQIPTVVACETLLANDGTILHAGGVLAQVMPDGDLEELIALRDRIIEGKLAELLYETPSVHELLAAVSPRAEVADDPIAIRWQCRCSEERVLSALELLGPTDLADMIEKEEDAEVACDFCAKQYRVSYEKILAIFTASIKARG